MRTAILIALLSTIVGFKSNEESISSFKQVAVIELFTAEGCSSCPAADELLEEMTGILQKEGKNVIPLSFHVTYWNKLGWEDPYSQELFTDRQKAYVNSLNLTQLYTPQAIINGEKEFVGSNPIAFRELVSAATNKSAPYTIEADTKKEENKVKILYKLNKEPKNLILNIAVVEEHIQHFIPRGENKSRTLKHFNVVRNFKTINAKIQDQIMVDWPEDLATNNGSIILYAQNRNTLKIVAAVTIKMI